MMKKRVIDLRVRSVERIGSKYSLLRLACDDDEMPAIVPGQFAEVRVDGAPHTFLRRPISVNYVDSQRGELWMLVAMVGEGTRRIGALVEGDTLNCVMPLGNGFSVGASGQKPLLVGGGVGVAPLLYLGAELSRRGVAPTFLIGARAAGDVLERQYFEQYGEVYVTTEDGSAGERGFVTDHSVTGSPFSMVYTCGPTPMMKAVARLCRMRGMECEASLERLMACGVGACLCCVEKTTGGNERVCTEGPVFNIRKLLWE